MVFQFRADSVLLFHQWSPSSRFLLFAVERVSGYDYADVAFGRLLNLVVDGVSDGVVFLVWDSASNCLFRTEEGIQLSRELRDGYIPFFSQYAKSVSLWNTESSEFCYSAFTGMAVPEVFTQCLPSSCLSKAPSSVCPKQQGSGKVWKVEEAHILPPATPRGQGCFCLFTALS
uniref:Uncharacterized protein n=1 Tax=Palpitomonas bilix TaxID=652834 RepID=A0A7S3DHP4_9EUKA